MYLGLGNMGLPYIRTYHNIGHIFIGQLVAHYHLTEENAKRWPLFLWKGNIDHQQSICGIVKGYMNLSGQLFAPFYRYTKQPIQHLVVIHDDIDLPIGKVRVKFAGGSAGHNGIKDLDKQLTSQYWRIRIGIGRHEKMDVVDYVLSKIPVDQLAKFEQIIQRVIEHMLPEIQKRMDANDTQGFSL